MKAETPQILWHNGQDNEQNKNAAIYAISMLESGMISRSQFGLVLCTAGNHEVNLWKLQLPPPEDSNDKSAKNSKMYSKLDRSTPMKLVKVELLTSLTRHDATVNAVQFSPNGLHLATASDAGTIIIYSVPPSKRGNGNGQHYWSEVDSESCLQLKILTGHDGIYDMDWSRDSRRFTVGTLDHTIAIYEDESYASNHNAATVQKDSQWKCCYRNARDHSHYLQGVAMDPQGTYVATASCDRTVRVYARKVSKKRRTQQQQQPQSLNDKLELGKGKLIKYYTAPETEASNETVNSSSDADPVKPTPKRSALFAEESASESFFRRLSFTTDGAYLITPAALWKDQAATLMFRRHCYDAPCKVLTGHDKPSRVICSNPVLFQLPPGIDKHAGLSYKSVFCVLTEKSILIYDTYHTKPIAMARGLHFSGLTHAVWAPNGHALVVSSSDGYLSFLTFDANELGKVFEKEEAAADTLSTETSIAATTTKEADSEARVVSPVTIDAAATTAKTPVVHLLQAKKKKKRAAVEPVAINVLQPKKKAKTVEGDISADTVVLDTEKKEDDTPENVNILQPKKNKLAETIIEGGSNNELGKKTTSQENINILQPKKKKRVDLTLLSAGNVNQ